MNRYKSPLRYPGGKQKLAPFVSEVMRKNDLLGGHYVEPYAGGAGVAVELLLKGDVAEIHLNDSCAAVHAFWRSILRDTEAFCRRISRASLTVPEWRRQKAIMARRDEYDTLDVGFSLFYLNRVNRSGIVSGGLIGGLAQDGEWRMDARFPRAELIRRIENIARKRKAIHLRNWDAERFIQDYVPRLPKNSLVYCDPPYFEKADRLYLNHYKPEDHRRIANVIQKMKYPWMVSYDSAPEILDCYGKRRAFLYGLQYAASKAYIGTEVFFFSDELRLARRSEVTSINRSLSEKGSMILASTLATRMHAA